MPRPSLETIRSEISKRNLHWEARVLPADFRPRGLGYEPAEPKAHQVALANAQRLMVTRMPNLFAAEVMRQQMPTPPSDGQRRTQSAELSSLKANRPRKFDWRDRGVVGPVTDQMWCGSCVSFAA